MPPETLFVGMDGGGTKTAVLARSASQADAIARRGPGVNPQRFGLDVACERLTDLLRAVRGTVAPDAPLRVYAGLAGAGRTADQQAIAARVEAALGGDVRLVITHDADIALDAAFPEGSGAIVIAGTGSVVLARTAEGARVCVGGWGYLLGDEGSGTLLGLEALRAVCRALDGGPPTALRALAEEIHGFGTRDGIIDAVYRQRWPLQQAAGLVLQAAGGGDAVAQTILRTQTEALAEQVGFLAGAHPAVAPRYVLLGGLNNEAVYRDALHQALAARVPDWEAATLALDPTEAALRRAETHTW